MASRATSPPPAPPSALSFRPSPPRCQGRWHSRIVDRAARGAGAGAPWRAGIEDLAQGGRIFAADSARKVRRA